MTRISYLLPTYNRRDFIGDAIAAVQAQMASDDELLVIDDGSTDGTADALASMGAPLRYVRQDNAGKSAALNRGLSMTNGQFVMICDDDDVLRPGSVEPLLAHLLASKAGFAFGRYSRFRSKQDGSRVDMGTGYWPDLSSGSLVRHILEDAFVMQNAAIVRRSAYDRVGPFDETMARSLDYEMFVRLALAVEPTFLDRVIFDQRKHDGVRGPARAMSAASMSDSVWFESDQRIFRRLHSELPLSAYEALFISTQPELLRRVALLQRACVNGRHGLWDLATTDLEAAIDTSSRPFDPGEIRVCARALNGKHGVESALNPRTISAFKRIQRSGALGKSLVALLIQGALWRLRAGSDNDGPAFWKLAYRLIGPTGIGQAMARRYSPKANIGLPAQVIEADAYNWQPSAESLFAAPDRQIIG